MGISAYLYMCLLPFLHAKGSSEIAHSVAMANKEK